MSDDLKRDVIARLISMGIGLTFSAALTYFAIKMMVKAIDPTDKEKQKSAGHASAIMKKLGIPENKDVPLNEYELIIASNLVDPESLATSWDDIGGLDDVIAELISNVLIPFTRPELFRHSDLIQAPKGVLLYGPPGCGKTMIARAMAKMSGARFINLQISSLTDKWYGETQKRTEAVFSLAKKIQPTIIFIDEIDSVLRSRTSSDHEATVQVKTLFMSLWDGLSTDKCCQVMVIGATNRPHDVDNAILRRMPCRLLIPLPSAQTREAVFNKVLRHTVVDDDVDIKALAKATEGLSGSDIQELCRQAALHSVTRLKLADKSSAAEHAILSVSQKDFSVGLQKIGDAKMLGFNSSTDYTLD